MTYGQAGAAVCPRCGSASAVHSVDELAAMARSAAWTVRAGVPAAAGLPAAAGVWSAAASIVGFPLAVAIVGVPLAVAIVGVPFGAAVRLPRAATSAAAPTATGLFGLGAAAGVHRAAASQPVAQRQFDEQLDEQLAEQRQ